MISLSSEAIVRSNSMCDANTNRLLVFSRVSSRMLSRTFRVPLYPYISSAYSKRTVCIAIRLFLKKIIGKTEGLLQ